MPIVAFRLHYLFEKANTDRAVSFRVIEVEIATAAKAN
jgi:hypothetical protein